MRNLDDAYLSSKTMIKALVFVILLSLSFGSISAVDFEDEDGLVQWQILTKFNFSSQIRTHPHILLLITVPCNSFSFSSYMCMFLLFVCVFVRVCFFSFVQGVDKDEGIGLFG